MVAAELGQPGLPWLLLLLLMLLLLLLMLLLLLPPTLAALALAQSAALEGCAAQCLVRRGEAREGGGGC